MKATGIVRRIDELGRVVIPKEIRRTLRIRKGDPLEIFTEKEELVLRKYSPILSLDKNAKMVTDTIKEITGGLAILTDRDSVLSSSGEKGKEFEGKRLSSDMEKAMENRKSILLNASEGSNILPVYDGQETQYTSQAITPILSAGETLGLIILQTDKDNKVFTVQEVKIIQSLSSFLAKQFEE